MSKRSSPSREVSGAGSDDTGSCEQTSNVDAESSPREATASELAMLRVENRALRNEITALKAQLARQCNDTEQLRDQVATLQAAINAETTRVDAVSS